MKKRNPLAVFFLGLITIGLYSWYWAVRTKTEMNERGEHIPTAWFWLIPFVGSLWWYWKYSEAVGHVTGGKMDPILTFILLLLLGSIGQAIIQDSFNNVGVGTVSAGMTPTPPVPPMPTPNQPIVPDAAPQVAQNVPPAAPIPPESFVPPTPPTISAPPSPPLVSG